MFDVPARQKLSHHWKGDLPIDEKDWNIGLIVGPSGAGKSSIAKQLFGAPRTIKWKAKSIIDDFDSKHSIEDIAATCSAVGFNSIPSWMKPYSVLSTGEKFRAEMARHLLEDPDPIVVDEFTSVVDRQVAKIGSHAVQRIIRKQKRKFVAATCHYDVIDWLQPDWMLEPATMTFQWRSLQRRPELAIEIARVDYSAWHFFAPFHYMSADLNKTAACFVLFVEGLPATFAAVLPRPHAKVRDLKAISRIVTLPDYQGIGLAMVLVDALGAAYRAIGYRLRNYPAHPSFVRSHDHSPKWRLCKRPGEFQSPPSATSSLPRDWKMTRPCGVFEYCGEAMAGEARDFIGDRTAIDVHVEQLLSNGAWWNFAAITKALRQKGCVLSSTTLRNMLHARQHSGDFEVSQFKNLSWRLAKHAEV
jgi:ABC-type lipoprotein export system ATPase subunit